MRTLRVRFCDFPGCNSDQGVCRFKITKLETEDGPRTVTLDLCIEHAAPLIPILEAKPANRRNGRTVTPLKEVTARKKTAKKTARKR